MKKGLNCNTKAGSTSSSEPRLLKDILHEMIHSNSPLSKDLREFLASKESIAEKGGNL